MRICAYQHGEESEGVVKNTGTLRFLASNASLYMTATVIQSAISFILIPLYARNLPKAEFGAMDQIAQFIVVVQLLGTVGLPMGMVRGFYLAARDEHARRRMSGALFNFIFPVMSMVSLGVYLFAKPLSNIIFAGMGKVEWVQWSAGLIVISSLSGLPLSVFRTLQASRMFAWWSVVSSLLVAAAVAGLLLTKHFTLTNLIIANCAANVVVMAMLFPRFFKYSILNFKFKLLRPMFAFGIPLLPNSAARKVLEVAGRYLLPHFCGLTEVGTFVMGLKIATILESMLLSPFSNAWMPYFYSQSDNPNAPALFARISGLAVMALCLTMLVIEAIKPLLLSLLGGGRFADSGPVVSALLLGFVINGIQYTVSPGIHLTKQLVKEASLMAVSAVVCIALNAVLIPRLQSVGAALAQTGGYCFYLCSTFLLSQYYYPVQYPWKKIGPAVATASFCWLAMGHFDNIGLRGLFVGIYAAVCIRLDPTLPGSAMTLLIHLRNKITGMRMAIS